MAEQVFAFLKTFFSILFKIGYLESDVCFSRLARMLCWFIVSSLPTPHLFKTHGKGVGNEVFSSGNKNISSKPESYRGVT